MENIYNKDNTYFEFAHEVYDIFLTSKTVKVENGENSVQEFKILESRIDKSNGFQAMAVAPIENDRVNTKKIVFAYAGTDPVKNLGADLFADGEMVLAKGSQNVYHPTQYELDKYGDLNKKVIEPSYIDVINPKSQYQGSTIWTGAVIQKYKPKTIYGTGHSLGGTLAQINAVMYDFEHTRTFSAPNGYNLLPKEIRRDYDAEKFNKKIIDYVHESDLIGKTDFLATKIGSTIVASPYEAKHLLSWMNPIRGHGLHTFSFKGDNVKLKVEFEEVKSIATKIHNNIEFINSTVRKLENYMENTKHKAKKIEQDAIDELLCGSHEFISPSDIENYMEELATHGKYKFYDKESIEETISGLKKTRKELEKYAEKLIDAAEKMEERDHKMSEIYTLFER